MGKINIPFQQSMVSNMVQSLSGSSGIPFEEIQQIINSIPGKTSIIKIEQDTKTPIISLSIPWIIECENPMFEDGTVIEAQYQRGCNTVGGKLNQFNIFKGINIIDPPKPANSWAQGYHNHHNPGYPVGAVPTPQKPTCHHKWKVYHGLSDSYEYCDICGDKR